MDSNSRKRPGPNIDLTNIVDGPRAAKRARPSYVEGGGTPGGATSTPGAGGSYKELDEEYADIDALKPENLMDFGVRLLNAVKSYQDPE